MGYRKTLQSLLVLIPILILISCGGGTSSSSSSTPASSSASVFTVGTDAPLPSVVSCDVTITGITLNNGTTDISVMSSSTSSDTIDFARLSGLHQLVDLSSVPTGTYVSATVTISGVTIGYLDTSVTPPTVTTITGDVSPMSAKTTFATPFTLNSADMVGLRMEFDLRKSLAVDSNGQITGDVTPTFNMKLLNATDSNVSIDDFPAGVTGVQNSNTFTVQGPHGRSWTVDANSSTIMDDPSEPISSFTTDTIVLVSGQINAVTKDIDASEIAVLSNSKFYLGGLLTYLNPAAPSAATGADLYVRDELPAINGIAPGDITGLTLNGSETYRLGHINLPITQLLFNNSAMVAGQNVAFGGDLTTSNGVSTLTVKRVTLRHQGQAGTVSGSATITHGNNGTFQLNDNWVAGVLLPQPLTVMTTDFTNFINVSGLSALQNGNSVRVVGFILFDSTTSQAVFVARSVEVITAGS